MSNVPIIKETFIMNKLTASIITSVITLAVTLSVSFGGFCYKMGIVQERMDNLGTKILKTETDLKQEIIKMDGEKAEKDIVALIFKSIDDINLKLDRLIESKKMENK